MKRFFFGGFIALCGLIFSATPVLAANTDNFRITNYDVHMELGRDEDKTSTLRTTLTITADFPPNQNRGIAPIFVKTYDGHSTSFNLESVTDEQGTGLEYHWEGDELRIGNADVYVSGLKTYVITYTQRNVTRYYADTNKDEFYWDAIGTEWRVPIEQARVSLSLSPDLAELNSTELQCYAGVFQSSASCGEVAEGAGSYTVQLTNIGNGQGATVALGFEPGTFKVYEPSLWEKIVQWWVVKEIIVVCLFPVILILLILSYFKWAGRKKELKPIAPEYIPPNDASVTVAATLGAPYGLIRGSVQTAQLIDLAVRHYIKIYETQPKKSFLQPAKYEIEVQQDLGNLRAEEREVVSDMGLNQVGSKIGLSTLRYNTAYAARAVDDHEKVQKLVDGTYGLREKNPEFKTRFRRRAIWLLLLGAVLLSPTFALLSLIAFILSFGKVLSDKGLALRRYLEGLKLYIGVAETERLKMLQSPEGAAKVGIVDGTDEKKLVTLYERVLPYAILFGQEKEWSKQLGRYYEQSGSAPDWYSGTGAFNAALFASNMSSFSSSAASVSGFSSSSGGSSGGGFSGGGGGGGGGGGW